MQSGKKVDITLVSRMDDKIRSENHRLENANKEKLKGVARHLYLSGLVKLNKANDLAESGKGLANMKVTKTKEKESE
jgi:predicted HTH domain antitoxin